MQGVVFTLPGMELARLADLAAAYLFVALRLGAFLMAAPAFGGRFVPLPVRIVATLTIALAVAGRPDMPDADALSRLSAVPLVLAELAVGLTGGLVLQILFAAAGMAGDRIANAMGLGFAAQVDPSAGGQSPVVAQIMGLAQVMVFLGTDAHLAVLRILLESYALYPPGQTPTPVALVAAGLAAGAGMFPLAAALMLPAVAGLLLLNLAVGVISRSAPQLNLFSVGFPLALLAGLVLLWLTAPLAAQTMARIAAEGTRMLAALLGA